MAEIFRNGSIKVLLRDPSLLPGLLKSDARAITPTKEDQKTIYDLNDEPYGPSFYFLVSDDAKDRWSLYQTNEANPIAKFFIPDLQAVYHVDLERDGFPDLLLVGAKQYVEVFNQAQQVAAEKTERLQNVADANNPKLPLPQRWEAAKRLEKNDITDIALTQFYAWGFAEKKWGVLNFVLSWFGKNPLHLAYASTLMKETSIPVDFKIDVANDLARDGFNEGKDWLLGFTKDRKLPYSSRLYAAQCLGLSRELMDPIYAAQAADPKERDQERYGAALMIDDKTKQAQALLSIAQDNAVDLDVRLKILSLQYCFLNPEQNGLQILNLVSDLSKQWFLSSAEKGQIESVAASVTRGGCF